MIRQAHTYMVSAMSGATLIAIAIAAFVLLVSAQVFESWPIAGLGGGSSEVSDARATLAPDAGAAGAGKAAAAAPSTVARARGGQASKGRRSLVSDGAGSLGGAQGGPVQAGAPGGQGGGSAPSNPARAQNPAAPSSSSSPAGNGGGGANGAGSGNGGGSASTPTGQVTETVNGTVGKVDESVLGGSLHESGVTEVTEGVVNGVVGPESPVGHVVDETAGAVGGLLHGDH